jgi:hypothetical protein
MLRMLLPNTEVSLIWTLKWNEESKHRQFWNLLLQTPSLLFNTYQHFVHFLCPLTQYNICDCYYFLIFTIILPSTCMAWWSEENYKWSKIYIHTILQVLYIRMKVRIWCRGKRISSLAESLGHEIDQIQSSHFCMHFLFPACNKVENLWSWGIENPQVC